MTAQAKPEPADAPALVVFGRDKGGKPHASAFTQSEAALATKAAELMGLRLLPVRTDTERALAAKVPRGRVFATGRAFVPFIKATLLTELQAAALNTGVKPLKLLTGPAASGAGEPTPAAPAAAAKPAKGTWHRPGEAALRLGRHSGRVHRARGRPAAADGMVRVPRDRGRGRGPVHPALLRLAEGAALQASAGRDRPDAPGLHTRAAARARAAPLGRLTRPACP